MLLVDFFLKVFPIYRNLEKEFVFHVGWMVVSIVEWNLGVAKNGSSHVYTKSTLGWKPLDSFRRYNEVILLIVQKSGDHHLGCIKPCK